MKRVARAVCIGVAVMSSVAAAGDVAADDVTEAVHALRGERPGARVEWSGGEVRRVYGAALARGDTAAASAESFLNAHAGVFGVSTDMLRLQPVHTAMSGRFTVLTYRQFIGDVPVHEAWLTLLVRNSASNPLVLANSSLRSHRLKTGGPSSPAQPRVAEREATGAVAAIDPSMVHFGAAELVYLPMEPGGMRLAWRLFADNAATRGFAQWEYFVDAMRREVIERRPGMYHTTITGSVDGYQSPLPLPDASNNPPAALPVRGAHLRSDTGMTAYTDADGLYSLSTAGGVPATVELDLQGRWGTVINLGDGGDVFAVQSVVPQGPVDFHLNPAQDEFVTAQLNAITGVTRVHDFLRSINTSTFFLNVPLPTFVNENDTCNAFYSLDTPSLTFFRAGEGCPNTAYASVIYHEYGHFLIDQAPGGPDTPRYHEAMADVVASMLLDDPCIAPDLNGPGSGCLRNIDTADLRYPCFGPVHFCSQVLSGAFWDMRTNLVESEGHEAGLALARELFLGQILTGLHTMTPGVTLDVLALDDDDENLFNGTPHYHEINRAFSDHGMPGPTVLFNDGDYNGDGDLDLFDYSEFHRCTTGPQGDIDEDCEPGDFDGDGDVDLLDFRRVSSRFTGDCGVLVTTQPQDVTACFGDAVSFSMAATGDIQDYVWTRNGQVIPGANHQVLVIDPVAVGTVGQYQGTVVGGCAAAATDEVDLSLPAPPVILDLPDDVMTCVGETASFTVTAAGWQDLHYQWFLDGEPIDAPDAATYTIDPVTHDDVGVYTCLVSDRCGQSVTTEDAPVTLSLIPPTIVTQPQLVYTCEGQSAEFSIEVAGPEPITYQWRWEGIEIPGANGPVLTIESVTDDDLGRYSCVVSDGCGGSALSLNARLTYGEVVINAQPLGGTFCAGSNIFLFVATVDGFTFQWFKDGVPIPGATNPYVAVIGATPADSGAYHLFAASLCNEVTSEDAIVEVIECDP